MILSFNHIDPMDFPPYLYYALGLIGSVIYIILIRKISPSARKEFINFAIGLIVVAFVYIGFTIWHQANDWHLIELGGLLIYSLFAYLGIKYSVWYLAIGWLLHILWDVVLHMGEAIYFVPNWYPPACLTFDAVVAAYIAYRYYYSDKLSTN